jgi:hypothetical protein
MESLAIAHVGQHRIQKQWPADGVPPAGRAEDFALVSVGFRSYARALTALLEDADHPAESLHHDLGRSRA